MSSKTKFNDKVKLKKIYMYIYFLIIDQYSPLPLKWYFVPILHWNLFLNLVLLAPIMTYNAGRNIGKQNKWFYQCFELFTPPPDHLLFKLELPSTKKIVKHLFINEIDRWNSV